MAQFAVSDYSSDEPPVKKKDDPMREALSSILYACSGDIEQYEETLNILEDSVKTYIAHLTHESIKHAKNPLKICPEDIANALNEDPPLKNHIMTNIEDARTFKRVIKSTK